MISRLGFLLLGFALFLSALVPATREIWERADLFFFLSVNPLLSNETFATLVSVLNSRLGDWISHLTFAALILSSVADRKKAFYSLILAFALIVVVQVGVNKTLLKKGFDIRTDSPSLKVESFINIEKTFPFPNNHTTSNNAFPGDHATTLFLATAWIAVATRRDPNRKGEARFAFGLALFFSLPRLIAGAHGLSDILAGAGGITVMLTPFLAAIQQITVFKKSKTQKI